MQQASIIAASMLRNALLACAWASMAVYVWWSIVFCIPTWSWEHRGSLSSWEKWRNKHSVRYRMTKDGLYTLYGWDLLAILMWWLPAFVAAICANLAAALPASAAKSAKAPPPQPTESIPLMTKVKRSLSWQLPPRKFWLYWCDGLNVAELFAVTAWIVIHCVGLWNFLKYYGKGFAAWDEIGWRHSVPHSVLWLERIALSFAWLAFIDLAMLFLPISHNSFLSVTTGLPYSSLVRYHRWLGHSSMWMIALHGIFFYFFWIAHPNLNFWEQFFDWGKEYYINVFAGSLALGSGIALWITSLNWVRRKYFEVFYKTHIVGFIGFVFFAMLHYGWMWTVFVPGLALYAADYVTRLTQSQSVTTAKAVQVSEQSNVAVVELQAEKGFSKCPIQDLFIMLPSISRWQWHPFTIMGKQDNPGGSQTITVAMKAYGEWTKEAIRQLGSGFPVPIRITGGIDGVSLEDLQGYDNIVLVAGGIAATPLLGLLAELIAAKNASRASVCHIHQVDLIWVARAASEFTILPAEILETASASSWLTISLFGTGAKQRHGPVSNKEALPPPKDVAPVKDSSASSSDNDSESRRGSGGMARAGVFPAAIVNASISFPTASAFFWNIARPLQRKSFGAAYNVLAIIAAFVGAFLGLAVVQAMSAEWTEKHYTPDKYYKYGMTMAISITIQTIGLPMMLVVLPANLIKYLKREITIAATGNPSEHTGGKYVSLMANGSCIGVPESGVSMPITPGRPNLKQLLKAARNQARAHTIGVFCAGPAAMNESTAQLVWSFNDRKADGEAHMDFHKFAFEL